MTLDHLWFQAAPFGRAIGLMSLATERAAAVITVLPKIWSEQRGRVHIVPWGDASVIDLTVWETDWVRFDGDSAALGQLSLAVSKIALAGFGSLLQAGVPSRPAQLAKVVDYQRQPHSAALQLAQLADRCMLTLADFTNNNDACVDELLAWPLDDQFLKALEGPLLAARPRYFEVNDVLATPRGRFDTRDAALAQSSGRPSLRCTFDDLSYDTPLLQVIFAALRRIAMRANSRHAFRETEMIRSLAVQYMQRLSSVTSLDLSQARKLAPQVQPLRFESQWKEPLQLATRVLSDRYDVPEASADINRSIHLKVPTEKLWEKIIFQVLERIDPGVAFSADNRAADGVYVPAPWARLEDEAVKETTGDHTEAGTENQKEGYPDYLFRWGGMTILADAKYKPSSVSLGSQDAYQLFSYSHLATLHSLKSQACIVIMPTARDKRTERYVRLESDHYGLLKVALRFPGPADIRTDTVWKRYLSEVETDLRLTLAENANWLAGLSSTEHTSR